MRKPQVISVNRIFNQYVVQSFHTLKNGRVPYRAAHFPLSPDPKEVEGLIEVLMGNKPTQAQGQD